MLKEGEPEGHGLRSPLCPVPSTVAGESVRLSPSVTFSITNSNPALLVKFSSVKNTRHCFGRRWLK